MKCRLSDNFVQFILNHFYKGDTSILIFSNSSKYRLYFK